MSQYPTYYDTHTDIVGRTPSKVPIRVLVVDDHHLVRESYIFFLSHCPDIEVVDEARNGVEAITLCRRLKPHVILMDVIMPLLDGIQATRMIHAVYPKVSIIALTGFNDEELAQEAIQAGAVTCLSKQTDMLELLKIIRTVAIIDPHESNDQR